MIRVSTNIIGRERTRRLNGTKNNSITCTEQRWTDEFIEKSIVVNVLFIRLSTRFSVRRNLFEDDLNGFN